MRLYSSLILGLCIFFFDLSASAQWTPLGREAFSPGAVNCTSLALGPNDTPYVAFLDRTHGDAVSVMKYNGSTWDSVGRLGFSNAVKVVPNEVSLVLKVDATGKPYVFYQDSAAPPFSVMTYNGTNWIYLNSAGITVPQAQPNSLSMDLDQSGTPYIAYMDYMGTYKASVMKYTGGNWVNVGPSDFTTGGADYLSLVIDKTDTPWLSFSDGAATGELTVDKFSGGNWLTVGSKGISYPDVVNSTSLAFDPSNNAYVAYEDGGAGHQDEATVKEFTDTGWTAVGDTLFTVGAANYLTMRVSPQGLLCVAFNDGSSSSQSATVYYYDGVAFWDPYGNADFSVGAADWVSLAIGQNGAPYVAFVDAGDGSGASVYSDQYAAGINTISSLSHLSVYPNPNSGRFQVSMQTTGQQEVQIGLYNMMGQMVWQGEPVWANGAYTATVDATGFPQGIYAIQIKTPGGTESSKIEIR